MNLVFHISEYGSVMENIWRAQNKRHCKTHFVAATFLVQSCPDTVFGVLKHIH